MNAGCTDLQSDGVETGEHGREVRQFPRELESGVEDDGLTLREGRVLTGEGGVTRQV